MNEVTSECKTVRALLQEYIEGTLTAARKAEVEAHLSRCHRCAQQVALITRIVTALEARRQSRAVNSRGRSRLDWQTCRVPRRGVNCARAGERCPCTQPR